MSAITNGMVVADGELTAIREAARGQFDSDLGGITNDEVQYRGRARDQIADDVAQTAIDRVRGSGVVELGLRWRMDDGYDPSKGGLQVHISAEAVLVAFMLLARENTALLVREATALLQFRLSDAIRAELDLPTRIDWAVTRDSAARRWEENFRSTLHRHILDPMDPYPAERHAAKTWEDIARIIAEHDQERAKVCKGRLDEFMHRFIAMTFGQQSRQLRRRSAKMDLSVDQTPMAPPTKKGYSPKKLAGKVADERKARDEGRALTAGPVDPFAGWYAMKGERADVRPGGRDETSPDNPGRGAELEWGWALNIAIRMDSESPSAPRFPKLIAAATLSMPNIGVSEEAVTLMRRALHDDLAPGIVDADMAYFGNATPERLHHPTRELGYTPSTEYRIDRLGKPQRERGGVQFIDGSMLCPSTPAHLKTAGLDHAKHAIDDETFQLRRLERRHFAVHVKERPNDRGKFRVSCPARGAAPTVTCPIIEMSASAAKRERPEITEVPDFLPDICRQHAITLDVDDNIRWEQAFDYGSPEWEAFHSPARQSIESVNKGLKEDHLDSLKTPGRRRVRGFTAGAFFATILIANFNLRKIAEFVHDELVSTIQGSRQRTTMTRARDSKWWNHYTSSAPPGLRPPESFEQKGVTPRRRTKRAAGSLPDRT